MVIMLINWTPFKRVIAIASYAMFVSSLFKIAEAYRSYTELNSVADPFHFPISADRVKLSCAWRVFSRYYGRLPSTHIGRVTILSVLCSVKCTFIRSRWNNKTLNFKILIFCIQRIQMSGCMRSIWIKQRFKIAGICLLFISLVTFAQSCGRNRIIDRLHVTSPPPQWCTKIKRFLRFFCKINQHGRQPLVYLSSWSV